MDISITGRNIELKDAIKEYIHKRLEKLPRMYKDVRTCEVILDEEKERRNDQEYIFQEALQEAKQRAAGQIEKVGEIRKGSRVYDKELGHEGKAIGFQFDDGYLTVDVEGQETIKIFCE